MGSLFCPEGYDSSVWEELPVDVKLSIISDSDVSKVNNDISEQRQDRKDKSPEESRGSNLEIPCPAGMDPEVFAQLPLDIIKELAGSSSNNNSIVNKKEKNVKR